MPAALLCGEVRPAMITVVRGNMMFETWSKEDELRAALDAATARAEAAEARANELEADMRSVPVMELMRAYPAVRWYVFNDEIRIRKWVEHIEQLYAQWLIEQAHGPQGERNDG
jgi:hypothetical protein